MKPMACPKCKGAITLTSLRSCFSIAGQPWGLSWAFGAPRIEEVPKMGPALALRFDCAKCGPQSLAFDESPTVCGWEK